MPRTLSISDFFDSLKKNSFQIWSFEKYFFFIFWNFFSKFFLNMRENHDQRAEKKSFQETMVKLFINPRDSRAWAYHCSRKPFSSVTMELRERSTQIVFDSICSILNETEKTQEKWMWLLENIKNYSSKK